MRTFKLWAGGDAHVGTDLARANRRSLADVILQAEQGGSDGGPPFEWDIMLDIGYMRRPVPCGAEVGGDLRQCGGHFEIPRQQEYLDEPVIDVFGRGSGGQYQVLSPHERLCTSGVVRPGGKDSATADAVLVLIGM